MLAVQEPPSQESVPASACPQTLLEVAVSQPSGTFTWNSFGFIRQTFLPLGSRYSSLFLPRCPGTSCSRDLQLFLLIVTKALSNS